MEASKIIECVSPRAYKQELERLLVHGCWCISRGSFNGGTSRLMGLGCKVSREFVKEPTWGPHASLGKSTPQFIHHSLSCQWACRTRNQNPRPEAEKCKRNGARQKEGAAHIPRKYRYLRYEDPPKIGATMPLPLRMLSRVAIPSGDLRSAPTGPNILPLTNYILHSPQGGLCRTMFEEMSLKNMSSTNSLLPYTAPPCFRDLGAAFKPLARCSKTYNIIHISIIFNIISNIIVIFIVIINIMIMNIMNSIFIVIVIMTR